MSKRHATESFPFSQLRGWYQLHKRALPWRLSRDPYEVWIAEVMSQQTTITGFQKHYQNWFKVFPSVRELAQASEKDLLKAWQGLGYYSRVRNLQKAARLLQKRFDQKLGWPTLAHEWKEFPGIGPYTSAAIASLCFGDQVLAVDGNVIRVLSRWSKIEDYYGNPADKKRFQEVVKNIETQISTKDAVDLNQSLMDLGATICRPKMEQTHCNFCPLKTSCRAKKAKKVAIIPKPKKRKETLHLNIAFLGHRNSKGQWLCRQIPKGERLEGQWELPSTEYERDFPKYFEVHGPVKHSITHHIYTAYLLKLGPWQGKPPQSHAYLESQDPHLTQLTRKLLKLFG